MAYWVIMANIDRLFLDVWREVSRHEALGESLARIMPLLAGRLPVAVLMIRAIDAEGGFLETTVVEPPRGGRRPPPGEARTSLGTDDLARLLEWGRKGEPTVGDARSFRKKLTGLVPDQAAGCLMAVPLIAVDGAPAILILRADPPRVFESQHEALARGLIDPLTVALENDNRLRELVMLREAVEAENRRLRSRLGRNDISDSIIGADTGLKEVMHQIELVRFSDAPVLILGETGSGKEVVARAIHTRSRRSTGPFLRVNCGAIPSELVDSELFGHERGSFTGAVVERKGWFERADGGTLFLDECGELPPAVQVRLLRILQDGQLERVGGEKLRHVDVRIIAATHRDLQAMTADGRFRLDLWYRMAVFPVHLPPLRERLADVAALASHFASRAAARLGVPEFAPTADDVELLSQYPWPGNIRELAAVMERAAILGNGAGLDVARALGLPATRGSAPAASPSRSNPPDPHEPLPTFDEAAARHIERALRQCGGRIEGPAGAAALLAVNPHTLRSRMRKLGVDWNRFRGPIESP